MEAIRFAKFRLTTSDHWERNDKEEQQMTDVQHLERRVVVMERRVRALTLACAALGTIALLGMRRPTPDVLRAQGLVITDAAGRERVVVGAPFSSASSNTLLSGSATGVAVLDTAGRLNVTVGSDNPLVLSGGRVGRRITSKAGVNFYDPRNGEERGGMGATADGRANICIDYDAGDKEAACLTVAPNDQYAAVILNGTPREPQFDRVVMYVGADGAGVIKAFGGGTNKGGVMLRAGRGPASIMVYDTTGNAIRNVIER
jgi:hypothetical protein